MITIDTWKGLMSNGSPYAAPVGSAVTQVNFQCRRPGELAARGGQQAVTFSASASNSIPVIQMFRCPIGSLESVVFQNSSGDVYIAKGLQ
jgi:hypothetical protein